MKLCGLLLIVAVSSGHYYINPANYESQNKYLCQQWCYKYDRFGAILLTCCDLSVRHGNCPKGCLFGYGANIQQILCRNDGSCPIGYKCCSDECSYFQKICKPIVYDIVCSLPNPPSINTQTQKSTTATTEIVEELTETPEASGFTEITITESNTINLLTTDFEASGDIIFDDTETTIHNDDEDDTETTITTTIHNEDEETTFSDMEIKISTPEILLTTTVQNEIETTMNNEPTTIFMITDDDETTNTDLFSGSGSGSGSGDDNILPPPADQPFDDDFYLEH